MSLYLSFFLTAVLLALTPGPDVLLVLAIAAKEGFKKALQLTLGLASGVIFHTALMIIGVSTLIATIPWAMKLIALFGAGYLLYLAWLTWKYRQEPLSTPTASKEKSDSYYWKGVIMNISNPKVLLFFLALFPQFALLDEPGYQWRIAILGCLFIVATLLVFGGLAYITAKSTQNLMKKPNFKITMDYITIGIFVLLAGLLISTVLLQNN